MTKVYQLTILIIGIYYEKLGLVTAAPTFGPKVQPYIDFNLDAFRGLKIAIETVVKVVRSVRAVEQARQAERKGDKTRQRFM